MSVGLGKATDADLYFGESQREFALVLAFEGVCEGPEAGQLML